MPDKFDIRGDEIFFGGYSIAFISPMLPATVRDRMQDMLLGADGLDVDEAVKETERQAEADSQQTWQSGYNEGFGEGKAEGYDKGYAAALEEADITA